MCGYWIGFIVYLLLIIGGIYALKLPKLLGIRYLIFSLFIDAFYISIPYQNIACQFIFGGLTLLTIFVNLSVNFVQSDKNKLIKRFELVFDFVLGIGLSIYLIYIIPNQALQNIFIPIVSAVYGGLLTLVGVAWTIRKSDSDRKLEEKKKAKPIFTFNQYFKEPKLLEGMKTCFPEAPEDIYECETYFEIENSNQSVFQVKRIFHDGKWFELKNINTVLPNGKLNVSFRFNNPFDIYIEIEDSLQIKHYYNVLVLVLNGKLSTTSRFLHTIREIKESCIEDIQRVEEKGEKHE